MFTGIRRSGRGVNVWPGYVDALSALLMVVIFVLLIFTLSQFLLRQLVSEQETELDALHEHLATLIEQLGLEQARGKQRQAELEQLSATLAALTGEKQQLAATLAQERQSTADARGELARLNQQIQALQQQLQTIGAALAQAEQEKRAQAEQIQELGKRLNIELARRVHELQSYRSEFFGQMRKALGENSGLRIEGDRFVFQSELLFASGSAELGVAGKEQLRQLAQTLRSLSQKIPENIDWVLRVDGHTDPVPLASNSPFSSNWELSTARALSVVRYLVKEGIPPRRLVAAGFGEYRPLDPGTDAEANRRNRRIEIKLTTP